MDSFHHVISVMQLQMPKFSNGTLQRIVIQTQKIRVSTQSSRRLQAVRAHSEGVSNGVNTKGWIGWIHHKNRIEWSTSFMQKMVDNHPSILSLVDMLHPLSHDCNSNHIFSFCSNFQGLNKDSLKSCNKSLIIVKIKNRM